MTPDQSREKISPDQCRRQSGAAAQCKSLCAV